MLHHSQPLRSRYSHPFARPRRVRKAGWAMALALAAVALAVLFGVSPLVGSTMRSVAEAPASSPSAFSPLRDVIPDFGAIASPAMRDDSGPTDTGMDVVPVLDGTVGGAR